MMFLLMQVNEAHDPFLAMVNCTSDVHLGERRQLCLYKKGRKKIECVHGRMVRTVKLLI